MFMYENTIEHFCGFFILLVLTFADSTLESEVEMLEIAFVTDMFDQKEAVDSSDSSLKYKIAIYI